MTSFGRDVCGDPRIAFEKEWLVTNGLGGYAMGTIGGALTRRYHGLLIAALKPPVGRSLLVSKVEETVEYDGQTYKLYCNQRAKDDYSDAEGCKHLEAFRNDSDVITWEYRCADALLEKRVWMAHEANATFVEYDCFHRQAPISLTVDVWVNCRDHHGDTKQDSATFTVEILPNGVKITPSNGAPYYVLGFRMQILHDEPYVVWQGKAEFTLDPRWVTGIYRMEEARRGFEPLEDYYRIGWFKFGFLSDGRETMRLVFSTKPVTAADAKTGILNPAADDSRRKARRRAVEIALQYVTLEEGEMLVAAADQFIVKRRLPEGDDGYSIIAGYPWFSDWGRDTMIALPGLTLATGRPEIARSILLTFARYVDQGMLPNTFPEAGETVMYNTVDATLWYFEAIRAYLEHTGDLDLVRELFPILEGIINWHLKGTRYQIHVDPADGLLYAGEAGVQLTWMDVKIGDWVVTPRTGKAVEINALWHNALMCMAGFARELRLPGEHWIPFDALAERVREAFGRFWCKETGYLYDVIDTPEGVDDASIRPNAVIAASLYYSPVTLEQARAVFDVAARKLYTSHGLRSLSPDDPRYVGVFEGDPVQRDSSYHQGTVWGWLIGRFVELADRLGDRTAVQYLDGMRRQFSGKCVGTLSEIFDGDPPHTPKGASAQAWTVAEVLRVLAKLTSQSLI